MSEHYYRYKADNTPVDLDDDEIYDYVLEREALKDLDNVGPRCMNTLGENNEHFGNLKGDKTNLLKNIVLAIVIIIVMYLIHCFLCGEKNEVPNLKPGNYSVRFNY